MQRKRKKIANHGMLLWIGIGDCMIRGLNR